MSSRPSRCPSCGGALPGAGIACPICGFTVRSAEGGRCDEALRSEDRAAGWAAAPLGPPPGPGSLSPITPPSPVGPPPSQIAVDGLDMHWSTGVARRAGWGTSAVAGAQDDEGPAAPPAGAPPGPAAGVPAFVSSAPGSASGATAPRSGSGRPSGAAEQMERAAARARRRRAELLSAAGPVAPTPVLPPPVAAASPPPGAGFDQVLSSDFRGMSAISGGGMIAAPPVAAPTRWAPSGASAVDFPGWFHGTPAVAGPSQVRRARDRAPLPRAAVWLAVVALLFVGFLVFTAYAQRWSTRPDTGGVGASTDVLTMPVPSSADRAIARRDLAALAAIAVPPSAPAANTRPAAALRARRLRVRLILWRDRFQLTAHQGRVLDHAVVYAGALARWLETPASAARRAAALKAWRVWRADDPSLRTR